MNDRIRHIADQLDRLADAPSSVLASVVIHEGACMSALVTGDEPPELTGDDDADRELAARMCGGCPVQRECLELELRWTGPEQVGVFGALPDTDRWALYPVWRARRVQGGGWR